MPAGSPGNTPGRAPPVHMTRGRLGAHPWLRLAGHALQVDHAGTPQCSKNRLTSLCISQGLFQFVKILGDQHAMKRIPPAKC